MTTPPPKPGDFWATCRIKRWVPLTDVLSWSRDEQPDTTHTRWDRKLGAEVCVVPCAFATTDRDEFEQHMADVHGRKTAGWTPSRLTSNGVLAKRTRVKERGVKLPAEGKPFKASTKDLARNTVTCPECGLVAEVDGRGANVLWWEEHTSRCTGRAVAS